MDMVKNIKRVTERRRAQSRPAANFDRVEWLQLLNEPQYSREIRELLERISEVNRLNVLHQDGGDHWIRQSEEMNRMLSLQRGIEKTLRGYQMAPRLRIGPDGWLHTYGPISGEGRKADYVALRDIHAACEAGILARLSRCECDDCGKWFLRRVTGQRFDSAKCRERAFKSTPKWKAYRRQKAREYYQLQRRKNVK